MDHTAITFLYGQLVCDVSHTNHHLFQRLTPTSIEGMDRGKIKLLLGASGLLFCSIANASLLYGNDSGAYINSLDIDTGASARLFASDALYRESGLAIAPVSPVPVPAAIWLFGTGLIGLIGLIGFTKRRKPA